jgi:hypothetical protein
VKKEVLMRPTHPPLSQVVTPPVNQPTGGLRPVEEKRAGDSKPPKKRSLNEAAHKLGY